MERRPAPFSITRLLPANQGEANYRGKSLVDAHERVISENAIRLHQAKSESNKRRRLIPAQKQSAEGCESRACELPHPPDPVEDHHSALRQMRP